MRQLEEENGRLNQLVADLALNTVILQEVLAKKDRSPRANVSPCIVKREEYDAYHEQPSYSRF